MLSDRYTLTAETFRSLNFSNFSRNVLGFVPSEAEVTLHKELQKIRVRKTMPLPRQEAYGQSIT